MIFVRPTVENPDIEMNENLIMEDGEVAALDGFFKMNEQRKAQKRRQLRE
jgi:hypothetical protein